MASTQRLLSARQWPPRPRQWLRPRRLRAVRQRHPKRSTLRSRRGSSSPPCSKWRSRQWAAWGALAHPAPPLCPSRWWRRWRRRWSRRRRRRRLHPPRRPLCLPAFARLPTTRSTRSKRLLVPRQQWQRQRSNSARPPSRWARFSERRKGLQLQLRPPRQSRKRSLPGACCRPHATRGWEIRSPPVFFSLQLPTGPRAQVSAGPSRRSRAGTPSRAALMSSSAMAPPQSSGAGCLVRTRGRSTRSWSGPRAPWPPAARATSSRCPTCGAPTSSSTTGAGPTAERTTSTLAT
mmetsp:Transcript_28904/g.92483  ORF Transcript_28904/g.92483 Transcript_28904/m.92483 type:complete len:291 (+) Transcript_28904:511-1383(+)